MTTSFRHATLALLLAATPAASSQPTVPNVDFRVAVRHKQDGKLASGVHILTLKCLSGECSLTSVSVNQCSSNTLGTPAFPIVVESSSTAQGTLRVTNISSTLKVEELALDIGGEATSTFLFGYELFSDGSVGRLTNFSGGFVKHSAILDKVITVEYVPFRRSMQSVKLDCPVLVPGLDLTEFDDLIETLRGSGFKTTLRSHTSLTKAVHGAFSRTMMSLRLRAKNCPTSSGAAMSMHISTNSIHGSKHETCRHQHDERYAIINERFSSSN